ncbi:MAG TPA: glycosyltransferase family 4 protein [Kofleriaceae bacterium]|nr:glycosyltransferase family 4 protein [Kofleriaceae bacterium]
MRVLAVTQIFPNAAEPLSAPFNRQQLAELGRICEVEVIAALPWFPGARLAARWSAAGRRVGVPRREVVDGLAVTHPRSLYVPRVGPSLSAGLYTASVAREVLRRRGRVDVLLGTWAYPDGCAAVVLARLLGVPAVVKLHGSDINTIGRMAGPRAQLRALLPRAARVVAVSRALAGEAMALGVAADRVRVVLNGVDAARFFPAERAAARAELGLAPDRRVLLYVGHLKESKGVLDLARAFGALAAVRSDVELVVVGEGDARAGMTGPGLRLVGARPHEEVPRWMAAADIVVLPSWHEGTPNVVIEALACGRRVIATDVGGVPDLITSPLLGELVPARQPDALAAALARAIDEPYDPRAVAAAAAHGSWADSAARLRAVLEEAIGRRSAS